MPRTLVTGATGFIGSHLAALLVERGDDVVATVRDGSRTDALDALDVDTIRADICDRAAIRRAMRGVERLFHVAGSTSIVMPRARVFALNVEGTRIVLEEALRAGVGRAVVTSSIAAIGPAAPGSIADESSVWDAGRYGIPYVDSKHEAEAVAMQMCARGLPVVIVNPAHVLGRGDGGRSSTALVRRFMHRQIPAYVDGTLNIVGVEDVACGHVLADEKGVVGERYILGNRNLTIDRLMADLARLSGIDPPPIKLPVHAALALGAAVNRIPGMRAPAAVEIRAVSLNWAFSNRRAKRELGWKPAPYEDCIEATIAWYRERDADSLSRSSTRQPLALRAAGTVIRWLPL